MKKYKKIYFLDRSAVVNIEHYLDKKKVDDTKRDVKYLRSIDKKNNLVSALISIIEGGHSFQESSDDKIRTINHEAALLSRFYKHASTDSQELEKLKYVAAGFDLGKHECKFENYKSFIISISNHLFQPIGKKDIGKYIDIIIDTAKNNDIDVKHPLVFCTLSTLCGNLNSRRVLKFKRTMDQREVYNALSDILALSRFPKIVYQIRKSDVDVEPKFITFDKSLRYFYEKIGLQSVSNSMLPNTTNVTSTTFCPSRELFPNLDDNEYASLMERLECIISPKS